MYTLVCTLGCIKLSSSVSPSRTKFQSSSEETGVVLCCAARNVGGGGGPGGRRWSVVLIHC
jgi:hypothetical protein